ncbi:LacI family transcriptional regulator [Paenibacillus sp. 32O-W]|uniref:substrate-binding domain-containing protein n=1 Tax=Paenibacillus sp. 32O-W TaxID=1695218 RepID=UPI0007214E6D|nr:substrate-binding domain-containing protein [Paenibacillus sp. 32O-W]ALS30111.1 LacI family transcriptional regulator [Paenibacillus sp. 32O-W]
MAKIDDVANKAGVSKGTVSNVFSQKRPTSKEVTERVLRASKELNYVPNHIARSLVTKKTMAIGLTIPNGNFFFSAFHNQFINAVVLEASHHGYRVLLDTMPQQEVKTQSLASYPIDGAIVMSPTEEDERIHLMQQGQIPFVTVGRVNNLGMEDAAIVDNDNAKIMDDICQYLTDKGHRSFMFLNAVEGMTVSVDRKEAFIRNMEARGIGPQHYIIHHKPDLHTTEYMTYGYKETLNALTDSIKVTAIIADDDRTAFSVLNAIKDLNLRVPEDVSLFVICGDMSIMNQSTPALTSMDLQPSELGAHAVRMLMHKLGALEGEYVERVTIGSKIMERDSCAEARGNASGLEIRERRRIWKAGIIGLGDIGNYHLRNIADMDNIRVAAICDINRQAVKQTGDQLNLPAGKRYSDYKELLADEEIDFVISGVSNQFHYDVVKAAIEAGKPIMSEKPFTRTMEEADRLLALYRQKPIPCMIGFSYRYRPCFQYAKQLLQQGTLGKLRHIHVHYLQEENAPMFNKPFAWRYSKAAAGSGVLADIGSHMIDAARFFVGEFKRLSAMMNTFIDRRTDPRTGELVKVDVDDYAGFQCVLEGDVMGTFYTHKNAIGARNQFEVALFGDLGTARFSVEKPNEVHLAVRSGMRMELVEQTVHLDGSKMTTLLQDFVDGLENKPSALYPSFMDGYRNQQVMQIIMDAAEDGVTKQVDLTGQP